MKIRDTRLSAVFDLYINSEITAKGLSTRTAENYMSSKKLALKFFGDIPVKKINEESTQRYYAFLIADHAPKTTQMHMIELRIVLKFCMRKGLKVMDIDDIKIPKVKRTAAKFLTEEEVDLFLKILGQSRRGYSHLNRKRNMAMGELLFRSGIRNSELCGLNRGDIKNREFVVVGKSSNPRPCYITAKAEKLINEYLAMRTDNSPALFIANQTGKRITPQILQKVFRTTCAKSDFSGVHPHTMRHSYATDLLAKGVDIRHISEFLGHQSLETTMLYTHITNPDLRRVYEKVHGVENITVLTNHSIFVNIGVDK